MQGAQEARDYLKRGKYKTMVDEDGDTLYRKVTLIESTTKERRKGGGYRNTSSGDPGDSANISKATTPYMLIVQQGHRHLPSGNRGGGRTGDGRGEGRRGLESFAMSSSPCRTPHRTYFVFSIFF